jgi:exodeoxyribonuclease VII large subunit
LIDDVAAVCCSTPTHAAEVAVPIDCRAASTAMNAHAHRLHAHARGAILSRARTLSRFSRSPAAHVARHRRQLHQQIRELRASARRAGEEGRELGGVHLLVLRRTAARTAGSEAARRRRELDRLVLALAAHDPARTLARGYALVEDRAGEPLTSAAAARSGRELRLRFHDGGVTAEVVDEGEDG